MRLVFAAVVAVVAIGAVVACGSSPAPPTPTPTLASPTADPRARIAAASRAWLGGDLETAIAELTRAGNDPLARALLARAQLIAGRGAAARAVAAQALAGRPFTTALAGDVSKFERIVVSPDGAFIATIQHPAPETITVWSTLDGRDVFTVEGHEVAFLPHGDEMLVAILRYANRGDATSVPLLQLRSASTGIERWSRTPDSASALAADRRGLWLLTKQKIEQLDVATGATVRSVPRTEYVVLDVSADGTTGLCAQIIVDLASGKQVGALSLKHWEVTDEAISPDGQTIAIGYATAVELYARDGTLRARFGAPGSRVAFLDDGTLIASDGHRVTRWDANGALRATFDLPAELTKATDVYSPASLDRTPVGAGGHAVLRRGSELVVVRLTDARPTVIASLGASTRADLLEWSDDGTQLAIGTARNAVAVLRVTGAVTHVPNTDRLASLQFDPRGALLVNMWPPHASAASVQISNQRVFVRPDASSAMRFVDAPEPIVAARVGGVVLVGAGASGTIYVWDAVTAEGLGTIASDQPVSAIAVRGDGRLLAVGRWRGGIEMWELASRTHAFTFGAWDNGWAVATPSGRVDGSDGAVVALGGGIAVPGTGLAHEPGLVAAVLAHPPPTIAIQRTPAPQSPPRDCLPAGDTRFQVIHTALDGDTFTYCLREGLNEEPYCFSANLRTRKVAAVVTPVDVLADREHHEHRGNDRTPDDPDSGIRMVDDGVEVCNPTGCRALPVKLGESDQHRTLLAAISDDAELAVVGSIENDFVEVFDVATAKRRARFRVRYGPKGAGSDRQLAFFAHDILAISKPCAGPCAEASLYTPTGRFLGPFPIEASVPEVTHFHDDLWIVADQFSTVAIQNTATGAVVFRSGGDAQFSVTPDRLVIARGDPRPEVLVLDRRGKLAARLDGPPRCKP